MILAELNQKVQNKSAKIAVIGLGYVGLPVAAAFAEAGFNVLGIEQREERVNKINAGQNPIEGEEPGLAELILATIKSNQLKASWQYQDLADRDIILIDVETPINDRHIPEYDALRNVLHSLGPVMKSDALVIVESTIAPGTMKKLVQPLLEESSGKKVDVDFHLGYCPERVMPGKLLANLHKLSRVVGGGTPETAQTMIQLYRNIVQADLDPSDWITAELVKTVENAYRDIQIAFANEVALICEATAGDVWKVRELVNKSPNRQMHLPGAGVGGHCIPKDPWLLAHGVSGLNVPLQMIPSARAVNDFMPLHMINLLENALSTIKGAIKGSRVLVLGYAYLENSDDSRNSPTQVLIEGLKRKGAEVAVHDPFIPEYQGDVLALAERCAAVLVMVAHRSYSYIDLEVLKNHLHYPIIVDGRNIFDARVLQAKGWIYRGIGKSVIKK